MNTLWKRPLINALEQLSRPVTLFYRDDDAGWATPDLLRLLDLFEKLDLPLDLATIPAALDQNLAQELRSRMQATHQRLGIHQHGFQHLNHQSKGRKCEFGDARTVGQQMVDIKRGMVILNEYFDNNTDPIFTPPWNRCNLQTLDVLDHLSFLGLSRDEHAQPAASRSMTQVPVHIDWLKKSKGERWSHEQIMQKLAARLLAGKVTGVMLHHQLMDDRERHVLEQCVSLLKQHPLIEHKNMRALIPCQRTH